MPGGSVVAVTGTEVRPAPEGAPTAGAPAYARDPSDLLHLVLALALTALGLALALATRDAVVAAEEDLLELFDRLPRGVTDAGVGVVQVVASLVPLVVVLSLAVTRRFRMLGYSVLAGVVAGNLVALVVGQLDRVTPPGHASVLQREGLITGEAFPDSPYLASAIAVLTALSPWMSRRWRRAAWGGFAAAVVVRLVAGTNLPTDLLVSVGLGWAVGSLVLLAFGSPVQRLSRVEIERALARAALPVWRLEPASVDARGSVPWFAEGVDGRALFVKALDRDQRSADLLFRLYRWLRYRNLGDARPFSSLRRAVEHEALVAMAAERAGVRTPSFLGIADVGVPSRGYLLAYQRVAGRTLDEVADDELTDALLGDAWSQLAVLRRHRIAHRDLRLANLLTEDGALWLIDFGFAEVAADDALLRTDVAELLCATAARVGAERAVDAAVAVVGADVVGDALPRIQPAALSGATRSALKAHKGRIGEVQRAVAERSGVEQVTYEQLTRVRPRTLLTLGVLGGAVYFLYPQLLLAGQNADKVVDATPGWAAAALALSLVTYVGAAMGIMGSVPDRLPLGSTFLCQLAATFSNRVTPAQVGGYAVNLRYLQKQGLDTPTAATGVGLNTIGGVLVHVPLLVVFLIAAGSETSLSLPLPSSSAFAVIAGVFVVAGAVAVAIPRVRAFLRTKVLGTLRTAVGSLGAVARRPAKLGLLLGGSAIVTLGYSLSLYASVLAFGGGVSFVAVTAAYLAGSIVASAAPTPGGLGAAEAALVAGLTVADLPQATAVPAVLLFRLMTFWLPILPGWLALRRLQRADLV